MILSTVFALALAMQLNQNHADHAMGFSHEKTTHHFLLAADGGLIQVEANDEKDTESRDQIRGHFNHIVKMFAVGDFSAPILVHDKNPRGAETMTRLKAEISYTLEKAPKGSRIRIKTKNAEALKAIHEFLRFQIEEHKTGDPTTVPTGSKAA